MSRKPDRMEARVIVACLCVVAIVSEVQAVNLYEVICSAHQVYNQCETCEKTCSNPYPKCPTACAMGYFCEEGYVKSPNGQCVKLEECPKGQVSSMCRPKERFLMCGCPRTCRDPVPNCKAVCRMGCYCEEGQVRDDSGLCVKLADCPPIMAAYKEDTSEPRTNSDHCPDNEEYRFCEPCHKTCDNPNPICPAQCSRGCFCKEGLLRDKDGTCVKPEKCSKPAKPIQYQMTCSEHQVYKQCETCEKTCSNPNPKCPTACAMGCFCEEGYVMSPNGQCVKLEECPKAEISVGPMPHDSQEPSIEDCAPDEEYFSCGWCEPSCSNPSPSCPIRVCTRGCLCRPPLLRHHSGHCVEEKDCFPQKCKDPNEEYVCRYGCELGCEMSVCVRPRRCLLGCHCRLGLLRDSSTGLCVTRNMCSNTTDVNFIV